MAVEDFEGKGGDDVADDDEVDDHKLEAPDAHDGVDHEDRGPPVKQEPDLGEGPSKISIGMSIL